MNNNPLPIGTIFLYKATTKCSPIFIEQLRGKNKICLVLKIIECNEADWSDYKHAYSVKMFGAPALSLTIYEEEIGKILQ